MDLTGQEPRATAAGPPSGVRQINVRFLVGKYRLNIVDVFERFAASVRSRESREKTLPLRESVTAFSRFTLDHLLCPAMAEEQGSNGDFRFSIGCFSKFKIHNHFSFFFDGVTFLTVLPPATVRAGAGTSSLLRLITICWMIVKRPLIVE